MNPLEKLRRLCGDFLDENGEPSSSVLAKKIVIFPTLKLGEDAKKHVFIFHNETLEIITSKRFHDTHNVYYIWDCVDKRHPELNGVHVVLFNRERRDWYHVSVLPKTSEKRWQTINE